MKLDIVCSQVAKKTLENIPRTQASASLYQHIKRTVIQTSFYWKQATAVRQNIPTSVNGADKRKTPVSCYHTGQHSKMPVKHVISSCTVAVNGIVQETINAVEPEFAAHGYANVKADVSTMTTLRQNCFYIPSDSPSKEDTVYNCECSLNRHIYENKMYYENNTGWPKNLPPFFSIRLNFNSNRYLTLFHSRYQEKSCNNTVAKNLTTSQVCRYSTL